MPAVFDMIDCNALEFWRAAWAAKGWRARAWNAVEAIRAVGHGHRAVQGFAATACVGATDARWAARFGGRAVAVVPNGVAAVAMVGEEAEQPTVVFSGTLDYGPNVDAVAFLCGAVWPLIRAAVPGAVLVLAGRRPVQAILALDGRDGVVVRANVADMAAEIGAAWVAVAPMRTGVGLKNKVLEAWACGRPVVMSPMATNGLVLPAGHAGLVQAGAEGFARAVAALLADRTERWKLGEIARDAVRQSHSWAGAARQMQSLLTRCGDPA